MEIVIMNKALWMRLMFAIVTALPIAACTASSSTTDSTGEYVDDASITTKVKAALLGDSGLKSFDISVTTDKDIVHLSGRVNTYEVKSHATQVASGIPGVRAIVNNIVVN
jgi:osmotically-inducible protein OsmY